jgi:hypothetical protein
MSAIPLLQPQASSGKRAGRRRVRDAPASAFDGADAGAVEYLVLQGVRPATRAAALLLSAASAAGQPAGAAAPRLDFARVRDVFRELRNAGARKPRLVLSLESYPAVLSLPAAELRLRLRSLQQDCGLEEFYQLPRTLEKHLAVVGSPVGAAAAFSGSLLLLGVPPESRGALLFAAPQLLCQHGPHTDEAWRALADDLGLSTTELAACASAHPPLLLEPLPSGRVSDRARFWRSELGGDETALRRLALATPAALTASPSVLRRKIAFCTAELGLSAADAVAAAPGLFGELSLDRTLLPRARFLLGPLAVPSARVAAALADWATASGDEFIRIVSALAPEAPDEARSEAAFRTYGLAQAAK